MRIFKQWKSHILSLAIRWWIFAIILVVGILVRVWDFGNTPAGLNPDEASIGVEAYYIYKFGMDRNGTQNPVHLISWGSGQNALYAYILIPFVALRGLNVESVRFPMMLAGIFSLPLMYLVGRKLFDKKYALLGMFFMAISPWHIINSRWAVESNILPFVFLLGFYFFLKGGSRGIYFLPAAFFLAMCLYAYGTTYVALPFFLVPGIILTVIRRKISPKYLLYGGSLFAILALPVFIFVLINTFDLETVAWGGLTIPHLPVEARYQSLAAVFQEHFWDNTTANIKVMFTLFWKQEDAFPWNFVHPYGYFYKWTFPLIVAGFVVLIRRLVKAETGNSWELWLLMFWLLSALVIGIMHPVNLTRINLIFIPFLFLLVLLFSELEKYGNYFLLAFVGLLFVGFLFFCRDYFGREYKALASEALNFGIIPAIQYATETSPETSICITEQTKFVYIYTLFVKRLHPTTYLGDIEWVLPPEHPLDPSRFPRVLGQFRFRLADCINNQSAVYILKLKEAVPNSVLDYKIKRFGKYEVYLPK